jgi:hypothetical protein
MAGVLLPVKKSYMLAVFIKEKTRQESLLNTEVPFGKKSISGRPILINRWKLNQHGRGYQEYIPGPSVLGHACGSCMQVYKNATTWSTNTK